MRQLFAALAVVALLPVAANAAAKQKTVPLKPKAPTQVTVKSRETVAHTARSTTSLAESNMTGTVSHYRSAYDPWQCEADWDQNCESTSVLQAEEGYQACRLEVRITTSDGHDAWFHSDPTNWYANDPISPDRFKSFQVTIHAFGNGNYFDHRGSKEVVEMTFDQIPASADNYTRFAEGCTMPSHD